MDDLRDHEKMGLLYLARAGHDQVGVIDNEEKLSAAIVWIGLQEKGYVIGDIQPQGGPVYRLTNKGKDTVAHMERIPW